jgi:3-hydroxyacyl-CoA dehydrogenase/3-hydroxy-2-methylbutyryl-CoA dehydrogenase
LRVEGSAAVVTGGVSGLGLGASTRLVRQGGSVVMLDVNEARGEEAVAAIGERAHYIHCDVRDPGAVADAVARSVEELGKIDILINAAGVAPAQRLVGRDGQLFDLELFRLTTRASRGNGA